MFFWALFSMNLHFSSVIQLQLSGSRRHSNFSAISPSWPLNLGDLSSLNYDLKCHMNGDTISALHSFTISSRWPVLQSFSQNHGSQNFNLWPQNRDACVFKYVFFSHSVHWPPSSTYSLWTMPSAIQPVDNHLYSITGILQILGTCTGRFCIQCKHIFIRSSNQCFHLLFTWIQNLFKHVTHRKEMSQMRFLKCFSLTTMRRNGEQICLNCPEKKRNTNLKMLPPEFLNFVSQNTKILSSITILNIDNKNKYLLSIKSAY